MTDLKALRREIVQQVQRDWFAKSDCSFDALQKLVEGALLQYAEACLGEPSEGMRTAGTEVHDQRPSEIIKVWTAMASQRLKEIK